MAAPWHNLHSKTDRALVAYLVSVNAGGTDNTYPAKSSAEKNIDCIVCWSHDAVEAAPYSGTYVLQTSVQVKTLAINSDTQENDEARIASELRVARVFDAFQTDIDSAGDKLGTDITNAAHAFAVNNPLHADLADLTILNVAVKGTECGIEEGTNAWVDTMNLEIVAMPRAES